MEHELYLKSFELSTERLVSSIGHYGDYRDITCLVGSRETEKQELLKHHGFRYAGKRLVEGTVVSVFTRFKDVAQPYEAMDRFFDRRVRDYDLHMQDGNDGYEASFLELFRDIPDTERVIQVLDLGCGTGAELQYLFKKAPQANVTGVDVSGLMLEKLLETYYDRRDRISILRESYLSVSFEADRFDLVVACSTFHHLLPDEKAALYQNIRDWLKPQGCLLIQDYVASSPESERTRFEEYGRLVAEGVIELGKLYHFDLPLTVEHETELLTGAGLVCTRITIEGETGALITAVKP